MATPSHWDLVFPPVPESEGLALELALDGSLSLAFWESHWQSWGHGEGKLGPAQLSLRPFPRLDEIWMLHMAAVHESGEALPTAWKGMCTYADDVRNGFAPETVPAERSVQSVYIAIAQYHLLRQSPDRKAFLRDALALCAHVGDQIAGGAKLLAEDLFADDEGFARFLNLLKEDKALYGEDRRRGQAFIAHLPGRGDSKRALPLLALSHPVASQFKLWARSDSEAPEGNGFALLVVESDEGVTISADPTSKVEVGFLAAALDAREEETRGEAAHWYDGKRHGGTIVAQPDGGTKLSLDDVLVVLRTELSLTKHSSVVPKTKQNTSHNKRIIAIMGLGTAALALVAFFAVSKSEVNSPKETARTQLAEIKPATGARGEELAKTATINLLASDDGPRSLVHYALIAGACDYPEPNRLETACRDAHSIKETLVGYYGYKRENVHYLVDRPEGDETTEGLPTAVAMRKYLEDFQDLHGTESKSTFLFYYSGHGKYVKRGQEAHGILQPNGFWDPDKQGIPESDRGWQMDNILDYIKRNVRSKHIMLLMDNCFSGMATGARGNPAFEDYVRSKWRAKAQVGFFAAQKGQLAYEDSASEEGDWSWKGHGAFTGFLLHGLETSDEGIARADGNKDQVVTAEELAGFVTERVSDAVKKIKNKRQVPLFYRFDEDEMEIGQFLFVPTVKR